MTKNRFQDVLCQYYEKICKDIYRQDFKLWCAGRHEDQFKNDESKDTSFTTPRRKLLEAEFFNEQRKRLIRYESNIWACIYRMAKSD